MNTDQVLENKTLAIEIYKDLSISGESLDFGSILQKIKQFLVNSLSFVTKSFTNFYSVFRYTTMNNNETFNRRKLDKNINFFRTSALPDINIEIPPGFSITFTEALFSQDKLYDILNAVETYSKVSDVMNRMQVSIQKGSFNSGDFNFDQKEIMDRMNLFSTEVKDYLNFSYKGFKSTKVRSIRDLYKTADDIATAEKLLDKLTGNYRAVLQKIKPAVENIYKSLNNIIYEMERDIHSKDGNIRKEDIVTFYNFIVSLSSATTAYGQLLGETQSIEAYTVSSFKVISELST